jgi:NADH:ubiquinone oxidoreductase subunit 5 (subunit L)/multisubunit Na+/H+ antiporter MnhA subunit
LRATQEGDLKTVLACSTIEHVGLIAIGLAIALAARASDLGPLARLALAGALLHILMHAAFKTLLFLGAGSAQLAAGTRRLDRLGGLVLRMPVTTACMLVGALSLAGLPPSAGFASEWVLLQSVLATPRLGGLGLQTLFAVVAAIMAMAVALSAAAAIRLLGVGFLGRPRSPRAAGAAEVPGPSRWALAGLAGLIGVMGLIPGPLLRLLDPVLRQLLEVGLDGRAGLLIVSPQADLPGYAALGITFLLLVCLAGVLLTVRRWMAGGQRRGAAWDGGFAAPPAWLPFGDPATQYSAASFAQPLARTLGSVVLAAHEQVTIPAPGDPSPAHYSASRRDPAQWLLFSPAARLRHRLSELLDPMHRLTIRHWLMLMVAALVLMLGLIAWQGGA